MSVVRDKGQAGGVFLVFESVVAVKGGDNLVYGETGKASFEEVKGNFYFLSESRFTS